MKKVEVEEHVRTDWKYVDERRQMQEDVRHARKQVHLERRVHGVR